MSKLLITLAFLVATNLSLLANPITLFNNTCSKITFMIAGTVPGPPPNFPTDFYGHITLDPDESISFSDPADFYQYPNTFDWYGTTVLSDLAIGEFHTIRLWDVNPSISSLSLSIGGPAASSFPYLLPCNGLSYGAQWLALFDYVLVSP